MKEHVSSYIRKLAQLIEEDDTPTEQDIKDSRPTVHHPAQVNRDPLNSSSKNNEFVEKKYTPHPKQKPPRRINGPKKFDLKETRNDYMKEYRMNGKDLETGNNYVKKIK